MARIVARSELCTGCRACELICSYYHGKFFSRSSSSIRVRRIERRGEMKIIIEESCDLCREEREPLCIKFCAPKALLMGV